jgi:hypothetical protein
MDGSADRSYGSAARAQLLDELVSVLVQPAPGCSELEQQAVQNQLFGYVLRVADSGIASNTTGDADTVFHAIRQRLLQHKRQDDAARCAQQLLLVPLLKLLCVDVALNSCITCFYYYSTAGLQSCTSS